MSVETAATAAPLPPKGRTSNQYRREDLNLHAHYGHMDLNHARLPIPPLRLSDCLFGHNAKIEKDLQEEARGKGIWAHCSHHAPHDDRSRAVMNGAIGKP